MNHLVALSPENKGLKQEFTSLVKSSGKRRNNITFANDWISLLGYTAINPESTVWIDWSIVQHHFKEFNQELNKISQWVPYVLIFNSEIIPGKIFSETNQLFSFITMKNLENEFEHIRSRISVYFDLLEHISKNNKKDLRPSGFSCFTGNSLKMNSFYSQILKISNTDFTVLITGSSGSGKELVAKTIHRLSTRKNNKFQSINCAAIPENLLESELFGFEKGAFTDASKSKPGKFELANGGTVFLDEIGDMPLPMQGKLLRVLEERKVERLGGTTEEDIDIRLLAATHKNLHDQMDQKTFREDLYYRLNVIPIHLPSLSEKKCDIPLLLISILHQLMMQQDVSVKSISMGMIQKLQTLPLKGNVRELENVLTRIILHSSQENLTTDSLDEVLVNVGKKSTTGNSDAPFEETINPLWKLEKMAISHALHKLNGNMSKIAASLEISRSALYRKMKKYHLDNAEDS